MMIPQRVWDKIEITDDCWLWHGGKSWGYGYTKIERKYYRVHRLVYAALSGFPPAGMDLDHLCRVRNCVNPAHLEPVDRRTNLLRGATITAWNAGKTHCPQGHEYTPENTQLSEQGWRHCRTCLRATYARYARTYRAKKRADAA